MNQTETSFRPPSTLERNFAQSTDNPGYFDNSGGYQIMQQQQQLKQQSQHLQLKQQQLKQQQLKQQQLKQPQQQHLQLKQQPQQQLKQQPQQQQHLQMKQQQHQQLKQESEPQQHLQLKQQQQLLKQQSQLLKQQQQHQQLILQQQQQHSLLKQQPQQHLLLKQQPQQQQADQTQKHISQMQHLVPYSLYSSPGSMLSYGQGPMHAGISNPALAKAYSTISSEKSHKFRGEKKPMPDDQKDDKYFERRRRNNEAAKRSRDARKSREDELTVSAIFLEQEQGLLLARLEAVKKENDHLKTLMFLKWQKMLQFNMLQAQQVQNKVQGTAQNSSQSTDPNSVEHQHKV